VKNQNKKGQRLVVLKPPRIIGCCGDAISWAEAAGWEWYEARYSIRSEQDAYGWVDRLLRTMEIPLLIYPDFDSPLWSHKFLAGSWFFTDQQGRRVRQRPPGERRIGVLELIQRFEEKGVPVMPVKGDTL
jgi:hypothetical protein